MNNGGISGGWVSFDFHKQAVDKLEKERDEYIDAGTEYLRDNQRLREAAARYCEGHHEWCLIRKQVSDSCICGYDKLQAALKEVGDGS